MVMTVRPSRAPQSRLDLGLGLGVERGCRLVQQQDRRVLEQGPRDPHPLLLAARELQTALADLVS